jgi:hypothetical protein
MPLEEGTCIQDKKEIMIPQDSKVTTMDSSEIITPQEVVEIMTPQDSKVTTMDSSEIMTPKDKVTTKDSREIIMPQTKGAFHKEIGGIMDLLGKEIIRETTGIILPPMVETMGKVEFHQDLTSEKVQFQIITGCNPSIVSKGVCKEVVVQPSIVSKGVCTEVVVTTDLNKMVHHSKIMVLQG